MTAATTSMAGAGHKRAARKPRSARVPLVPSGVKQKMPAPAPAKRPTSHPSARPDGSLPSLPIKVLQGRSTRRTDASHPGYGRDVVFVTRKVSLGALMGRCKTLLVDEGYTRITLYAMTAAIPHALLLLHALMDILPFPKGPKGMWYEIHTGSAECIDEVDATPSAAAAADDDDDDDDEFKGIGSVEEAEPETKSRINSTICIDLHLTPRRSKLVAPLQATTGPNTSAAGTGNGRKARPSKRQRQALAQRRQRLGDLSGARADLDEEEMMNAMDDEEEEPVEEVEDK